MEGEIRKWLQGTEGKVEQGRGKHRNGKERERKRERERERERKSDSPKTLNKV